MIINQTAFKRLLQIKISFGLNVLKNPYIYVLKIDALVCCKSKEYNTITDSFFFQNQDLSNQDSFASTHLKKNIEIDR